MAAGQCKVPNCGFSPSYECWKTKNLRPIRIGCTGVHSGGKSSSVKEIMARLKGRKYTANELPEQARISKTHGFELDLNATAEAQLWVLASQIRAELDWMRDPAQFMVLDRVVYDSIPYSIANPRIDASHLAAIIHIALTYGLVYPYDLLIYHPPFPSGIEDDGVRATDRNYQLKIDQLFRGMFKKLELRVVAVSAADKEIRQREAAQIVFDFIRQRGI